MILAYFGPDNLLPLTSIIATAMGFFMMFGRRSFRFVGWFLTFGRGRERRTVVVRAPHTPPPSSAPTSSETAV